MKRTTVLLALAFSVFFFSGCTAEGGGRGVVSLADVERDLTQGAHTTQNQTPTINVTEAPYNICSNCEKDQTEKIIQAIADGVAQSKTVYFPKGTYHVSKTIATVGAKKLLLLKGESRTLTTIQLDGSLGDRGLIEVVGAPTTGPHARIEMSDITLSARSGAWSEPGYSADALRLSNVVLAKFESVSIEHFSGAAIRGYGWWDSVLTDVHIIRSGNEATQTAAVVLGSRDGNNSYGSTNNLSFTNCRWESNYYVSLRMMEGTRKIHILASKFHGLLPQAAPYDHVQMVDANSNTFSQNNFTNGGGTSLRIVRSYGNNVSGNTIGGQPGYAIYMKHSPRNVIMGNNLNTEASSSGMGDIFWETNPQSTYLGNVGRRDCTLAGDNMYCGPLKQSSVSLLQSILR